MGNIGGEIGCTELSNKPVIHHLPDVYGYRTVTLDALKRIPNSALKGFKQIVIYFCILQYHYNYIW